MSARLLCVLALSSFAAAFTGPAPASRVAPRTAGCSMGNPLFDMFKKAFANEDYSNSAAIYQQTKARARHILVPSEEQALELRKKIEEGSQAGAFNLELFQTLAKTYSTCNSASGGGSLGGFSPGTMVPEFDAVIFDPESELNTLYGPVQTKFGYHLISIDSRVFKQ